jgi:hypothetical protein
LLLLLHTIDLVKEYNRWLQAVSLLKQHSQLAFSLADPFTQAISAFAHKE